MEPDNSDLLQTVIQQAQCAFIVVSTEGEILFISPFAARTAERDAEELLGASFLDSFVGPNDRREMESAFTLLRADDATSVQGVECALPEHPSNRALAWRLQRIGEFAGRPAVLAIGHDYQEHQHTRLKLDHQKAMLRAVLETAVDGIITIDEKGTVLAANPAVETIFGYSCDELMGENIKMLMPSPYREEHDQYLANYMRTGVRKIIGIGREVSGLRKDGSTFPMDVAVSEVSDGAKRTFTGIVRDITDRRQAEERAFQAERLAAIGQMIAGLAHESRNAFQRSQACLELLELEVKDQPDALELVRRIQRAHQHLHHLYEEVRDYAAPIRLAKRPCDVSSIWRDTWLHLDIAGSRRSIELVEETEGVDLICSIDENALEQVFRNILENAIDASPENSRIVITCENTRLAERPALRIAFRDSGSGLTDEAISQLFEPFFTTKTKGTGLGMAIANRIVEAHGGTVAATRNRDVGAQITVTLPQGGV